MNKYETMYILRADLAEDAIDAQAARYSKIVTDAKGAVEKLEKTGVKRLAYPIAFKTEGYYVLMAFTAPGTVPAEMERQMKINEDVLRYIVVKRDPKEGLNPAPEKKPAQKPAAVPNTNPNAKPAVQTDAAKAPAASVASAAAVKEEGAKTEKAALLKEEAPKTAPVKAAKEEAPKAEAKEAPAKAKEKAAASAPVKEEATGEGPKERKTAHAKKEEEKEKAPEADEAPKAAHTHKKASDKEETAEAAEAVRAKAVPLTDMSDEAEDTAGEEPLMSFAPVEPRKAAAKKPAEKGK